MSREEALDYLRERIRGCAWTQDGGGWFAITFDDGKVVEGPDVASVVEAHQELVSDHSGRVRGAS